MPPSNSMAFPTLPTLPPPTMPLLPTLPPQAAMPRIPGFPQTPMSLAEIYNPQIPTVVPPLPLQTLPPLQSLPGQPPIGSEISQIQQQLSRAPPIQIHRLYSSIPSNHINNDIYKFYPYHNARYYFNDKTQIHELIHPHRLPASSQLPQNATAAPSHPLSLYRPIFHGLRNEKNHELATHHYGDHPRVVHTNRNQINIQPQQPHPDHPPILQPQQQPMHYPYHHPTGHHSAVHVNPTNIAYHVDANNHGVGVPGLVTFWYMCDTHNCQG
uniref:Uncharacterized protein n=1 Tax=Panagrolaimus sp. ES5 TaxID=591445 RepID=A0AC34FPJ9_9BILA